MADFTPGPWRVTTGGFSSAPDWVETFSVKGPPSEFMDLENIADAYLIAAAPELYEALSAMVGAYGSEFCSTSNTLAKAQAALAKARGEK